MKRGLAILLAGLLVCGGGSALALKEGYTLSTLSMSVLQSSPDRTPATQAETVIHDAIPGQSPVTGLPWTGDYLPMLVQIDNSVGTIKVNGHNVKTAGVGKYAPWGIQYADIIYEEMLVSTGATRFAALFNDCFAQGQPSAGVGPVRSCRNGPLMLRAQWQAGLVYRGGFAGFQWEQLQQIANAVAPGTLIDTHRNKYHSMTQLVRGKRVPYNLSVDLIQMRETLRGVLTSTPHPFLFKDEPYSGGTYAPAHTIHLDWGDQSNISHFLYDESTNAYLRYSGPGTKASRWALFAAFTLPVDTSENSKAPLPFANLIVQRMTYEQEDGSKIRLNLQTVGHGNADIFIDGLYIPGYWVCTAADAPTVFYDDRGEELRLNRGKTFIAQFPNEALCTYTVE